jgi:hypothetical protein
MVYTETLEACEKRVSFIPGDNIYFFSKIIEAHNIYIKKFKWFNLPRGQVCFKKIFTSLLNGIWL